MRPLLSLAAVAALTLTACAAEPPRAGSVVKVTLSEFAFTPKQIVLKAGQPVTLELRNRGQVQHEFMAGSGVPEHEGYADDLFAGVDIAVTGSTTRDHVHRGFGIIVAPGKTARATFTVPDRKGAYEIGCFELGHYASGMVGRLVIE